MTASSTAPEWSKSVAWKSANILKPNSYKDYLKGADAVVHSMGILLEADYKGVIQGRESPISGLYRAFASSKQGSQDPMKRKDGEDLQPQERDGQFTYELMNRDSGTSLNPLQLEIPMLTPCSRSHHARPRSPRRRTDLHLCLHLRLPRHPPPPLPLPLHQARGRGHHRARVPLAPPRLRAAVVHVRRQPVVHPAHCRRRDGGQHGK